MQDLQGKVAVITGAASGIGRALADRAARDKMRLVLADIEDGPLQQAAETLRAKGTEVLTVVANVSKAADVENLAEQAFQHFGGAHVLFNNAGVSGETWIWKNSLENWEWILGVNLWGVIHGIRAFVPRMLEQNTECHIVNTSSFSGFLAFPGSGIYKATKHAVVSISETLALEMEQIGAKIGVSVLCPGGVNTRIIEAERNRPRSSAQAKSAEPGPDDSEASQKFWTRVFMTDSALPIQVANQTFQAIRENRFYILTHRQYDAAIRRRLEMVMERGAPANAITQLNDDRPAG
ncbi:MAG: SDR family NAD(P)-dependent oxidoreductase [Planctomycetaceae bacterium]